MKRLLLIGFAACIFALAPILSASAMPSAHPNTLTGTDNSIVQVRGATATVGAITAAEVIIMGGVEAEATIMVGGIITIGGD